MRGRVVGWMLVPLLGFGVVWSEGIKGAIAQESVSGKKAEADRLLVQGVRYRETNQDDVAIQVWEEALKIYRVLQERKGEAYTLNNLGITYGSRSQYQKAISYFQQALPIFHELRDPSIAVIIPVRYTEN